MPRREYRWVRVKALTREEKAAIAVVCDRFVAEFLERDVFRRTRPGSSLRGAQRRSNPASAGSPRPPAGARDDDTKRTILEPRFLPGIRPTEFNYPVDIFGKWRGSKYSFITRYRSGFADNLGEEFNSAFTRLDHVEEHISETRFDVMWHRHTGQWLRLHAAVTLEEALRLVETDGLLHPVV